MEDSKNESRIEEKIYKPTLIMRNGVFKVWSTIGQISTVSTNLLGGLGGAINDDRTRLLMAIKPFLSEKRAPYMDSAVTILKMASMGKLGKDLKLF